MDTGELLGRAPDSAVGDMAIGCTPLEARAEAENLDALHAERRRIATRYAELKPLHGPSGKWDNKRKALLEAKKVMVRMAMRERGDKSTDAAVDAEAHAEEGYGMFLDQGIADATEYVLLEIQMSEITERIKAREAAIYAYAAEARLGH